MNLLSNSLSHFYDQKKVSDTVYFLNGCFIVYFLMTNRKWATLYIILKCDHTTFIYDPQQVSDIAHFYKSSMISFSLYE